MTCYMNGFALDSAAWNIETLSGRRQAPSFRSAAISIPGRSGEVVEFDGTYDPGKIILSMWVIGCDEDGLIPTGSSAKQEFDYNLDRLLAVFMGNPTGLSLYQEDMADGSVRCADVYVSDVITPDMFGANMAKFAVNMTIPNSFKYENSDLTFSITNAAAGDGTHNLSQFIGSTAPLGPIRMLVTGPITDPKVMCTKTSKWVKYTGTVASGDQWLLDTGTYVSRKGTGLTLNSSDSSGSDTMGAVTTNSRYRLLDIAPGFHSGDIVPQVELTGSATALSTALAIRAKRRFLS